MRQDEISMLQDTLDILHRGFYEKDGRRIPLKLSAEQMKHARVYLPEEIGRIGRSGDVSHVHVLGRCEYVCENTDSFRLARKRAGQSAAADPEREAPKILVLNFANPVHPGGGVRRGARAQEEDLCRKSSLLLSLEGEEAAEYYEYNRRLHTYLGSDAVVITPEAEIIRDERGGLLNDSVVVSVMTCAAPMLAHGLEGLSQQQYEEMFYRRIEDMLKLAAHLRYENLVLGAFGCGAFGNDARLVSDLFLRALKEFDFDGMKEKDVFRYIGFAVLDRTAEQYNFREFSRNFSDFYRDEKLTEAERVLAERKEREVYLDAIRGCLLGGAAGDALGYPVEFLREEDIFGLYGSDGITSYRKDDMTGKALISDDTQMTLFTANGLLVGETRGAMRGIQGYPRHYVDHAYQDWLKTQVSSFREVNRHERYTEKGGFSWLLDIPELYARRAPGTTCLSALAEGGQFDDYVEAARNGSKGCGGIMRVAPLALGGMHGSMEDLDREGAQLAAITHGHSLGYMPAAVLVHVIRRIVFPPEGIRMPLKDIIREARDTVAGLFAGDKHLPELTGIIDRAVFLAESGADDDLDNIRQLGEGWVAEETLGIAFYCALRHQDDFSAGIIAAVNHSGDSDSTGAVTGNILGALLGYEKIEEKWKKDLELADVILETADDLCYGCPMSEYGRYEDPVWMAKYIRMHRPER